MLDGGSSSSSSSSNTETRDERVAASDQGIAIGAGATVNIDGTTPEAWEFGEETVKQIGTTGVTLIDGVVSFGESAIDLVSDTQAQLVDFIEKRTQTEATTLAQDALKLALPIGVAVVAVYALKALRG